jgi:hypothetical protein
MLSSLVNQVKKEPKYLQDFSKQFIRNWYIDNGWKRLYDEGKSQEPPMMHGDALAAYSDSLLSFASVWSGRVAEIVEKVGDITRPLTEVATELFVLERLNRNGLVPLVI